jgi:hypothetical protein
MLFLFLLNQRNETFTSQLYSSFCLNKISQAAPEAEYDYYHQKLSLYFIQILSYQAVVLLL